MGVRLQVGTRLGDRPPQVDTRREGDSLDMPQPVGIRAGREAGSPGVGIRAEDRRRRGRRQDSPAPQAAGMPQGVGTLVDRPRVGRPLLGISRLGGHNAW